MSFGYEEYQECIQNNHGKELLPPYPFFAPPVKSSQEAAQFESHSSYNIQGEVNDTIREAPSYENKDYALRGGGFGTVERENSRFNQYMHQDDNIHNENKCYHSPRGLHNDYIRDEPSTPSQEEIYKIKDSLHRSPYDSGRESIKNYISPSPSRRQGIKSTARKRKFVYLNNGGPQLISHQSSEETDTLLLPTLLPTIVRNNRTIPKFENGVNHYPIHLPFSLNPQGDDSTPEIPESHEILHSWSSGISSVGRNPTFDDNEDDTWQVSNKHNSAQYSKNDIRKRDFSSFFPGNNHSTNSNLIQESGTPRQQSSISFKTIPESCTSRGHKSNQHPNEQGLQAVSAKYNHRDRIPVFHPQNNFRQVIPSRQNRQVEEYVRPYGFDPPPPRNIDRSQEIEQGPKTFPRYISTGAPQDDAGTMLPGNGIVNHPSFRNISGRDPSAIHNWSNHSMDKRPPYMYHNSQEMQRGSYDRWCNELPRQYQNIPQHQSSSNYCPPAYCYSFPYPHPDYLESVKPMKTTKEIMFLSLPEDRISLSEILCIIRENIEVFIATETDVKAPAPGRKRPIIVNQVGLRCIHCRLAKHQSDKVKRAVCFPSSIKRIYRTVIDMKLDHFNACPFVPLGLKIKLEELKATSARSTGTTMQYFVQTAQRMGMVDGNNGIRFANELGVDTNKNEKLDNGYASSPQERLATHTKDASSESYNSTNTLRITNQKVNMSNIEGGGLANEKNIIIRNSSTVSEGLVTPILMQGGVSFSLSMTNSIDSAEIPSITLKNKPKKKSQNYEHGLQEATYHGKVLLSLAKDKTALSPLRCFLRENVYAFSATSEDIAVRTPTTFSVALGQVGIGCIHCHSMPAKERSNRAVCFPFSIGRIYQSVADIQRFHLGECKMVPEVVRETFFKLQLASSKGSKGLATKQYWVSTAKQIGLEDTQNGIRFKQDPSSLSMYVTECLDNANIRNIASEKRTPEKLLVLSEDEPRIAEFLYVVMKQLRPCRFTEADRNKRRLKDVGCIGVECRHCAGQVDGRKFFWSSVNAVESNFISVHTHMMECRMISPEFKKKLALLKTLRKDQTAMLKSGSQKAFFSQVWKRLHSGENKIPRTIPSNPYRPTSSNTYLTSSYSDALPIQEMSYDKLYVP